MAHEEDYARRGLLKLLKERNYNIPKAEAEKFLQELEVNTHEMEGIVNEYCNRMLVTSPHELETAETILADIKNGAGLIGYAARMRSDGECLKEDDDEVVPLEDIL